MISDFLLAKSLSLIVHTKTQQMLSGATGFLHVQIKPSTLQASIHLKGFQVSFEKVGTNESLLFGFFVLKFLLTNPKRMFLKSSTTQKKIKLSQQAYTLKYIRVL
jgi:hypothetical protein